jgi:hypothetical protein
VAGIKQVWGQNKDDGAGTSIEAGKRIEVGTSMEAGTREAGIGIEE